MLERYLSLEYSPAARVRAAAGVLMEQASSQPKLRGRPAARNTRLTRAAYMSYSPALPAA